MQQEKKIKEEYVLQILGEEGKGHLERRKKKKFPRRGTKNRYTEKRQKEGIQNL
jgi:hypothetical protein